MLRWFQRAISNIESARCREVGSYPRRGGVRHFLGLAYRGDLRSSENHPPPADLRSFRPPGRRRPGMTSLDVRIWGNVRCGVGSIFDRHINLSDRRRPAASSRHRSHIAPYGCYFEFRSTRLAAGRLLRFPNYEGSFRYALTNGAPVAPEIPSIPTALPAYPAVR